MGRDTETGSEVFEEDNSDLKSISHNFSSLSGSVSNICWVNIKVREHLHQTPSTYCLDYYNVFPARARTQIAIPRMKTKK